MGNQNNTDDPKNPNQTDAGVETSGNHKQREQQAEQGKMSQQGDPGDSAKQDHDRAGVQQQGQDHKRQKGQDAQQGGMDQRSQQQNQQGGKSGQQEGPAGSGTSKPDEEKS